MVKYINMDSFLILRMWKKIFFDHRTRQFYRQRKFAFQCFLLYLNALLSPKTKLHVHTLLFQLERFTTEIARHLRVFSNRPHAHAAPILSLI